MNKDLNVCIVTHEFNNLNKTNIAISNSFITLADSLLKAGHQVTILYVPNESVAKFPALSPSELYKNRNIRFIPLVIEDIEIIAGIYQAKMSYAVFHWLRSQPVDFDVVHFIDVYGFGYYSLLAKHQGIAFQDTVFCVTAFGPLAWTCAQKNKFIDAVDLLEIDFLERESLRLTDINIFTDQEMLHWMQKQKWSLADYRLISELDTPEKTWTDLHKNLPKAANQNSFINNSLPLVSVCLVHFNRPQYLKLALESLRAQDYPHFEVVLVDDGSSLPEAIDYLDRLKDEFEQRGWSIIRQSNKYLGAARNTAVKNSRGEYLLFMDDDNYAMPNEISQLVKVIQHTQAHILTCSAIEFFDDDMPWHESSKVTPKYITFLGSAVTLGVFKNCYGDANALVQRDCFFAVRGFTEDHGLGFEDWEFFARAVLKGFSLETMPIPLYWYRVRSNSMMRTGNLYLNHLRVLRAYQEILPPSVCDIFKFVLGQEAKRQELLEEKLDLHTQISWNQLSWKITRPFRNLYRRIKGLPKEKMPKNINYLQYQQMLQQMRNTLSWKLLSPLRWLRKNI